MINLDHSAKFVRTGKKSIDADELFFSGSRDATRFPLNKKLFGDGLELLAAIKDEVIPTAIFDPQYRGVLDKLKYGNEGARQKDRFLLQQMDYPIIGKFIQELSRVLRPSSHMFFWVDKFHLCQGIWDWLKDTKLTIVDMVTWDKARMGMGYRTRRCCEYVFVLQKSPVRVKGHWRIKNIRDNWVEKINGKTHAHQKPIELQARLIEAVTLPGELVLDPCAGSFSTMESAHLVRRNFLGVNLPEKQGW